MPTWLADQGCQHGQLIENAGMKTAFLTLRSQHHATMGDVHKQKARAVAATIF